MADHVVSDQVVTEASRPRGDERAPAETAFPGELLTLDPPRELVRPQRSTLAAAERDSTYRRLLGSADVLAAAMALVATATFTHTAQVYWSMFIAVLLVVPIGKVMGLYDRDAHVMHHTTLDEVPKLFTLSTLTAVMAFIARDLTVIGDAGIGTKQLVFLIGTLTVFFALGRVVARMVARELSAAERLLVVGDADQARDLARRFAHSPGVKAEIIGRVPITAHEPAAGHDDVLGGRADLSRVVDAFAVDRIVLIPGDHASAEISDVVRAVKGIGVKISLVPQLFDATGWAVETDEICGEQLMGVRDFRMTTSSALVKRATDIACASAMLLVAAPAMLVAAIAIRLDSRGPVLFRQPRIGRGGEEFKIVKFRTMRVGAEREQAGLAAINETNGLFKAEEDPRITRVGGFLRRSHIDELPQLINVLRGEMSLVGPRPLVPEEDASITGWYRRRSQITPGITGVWQLHGPVALPLDEMVKLDYLYVATWSWWGDLKIMLRTGRHILARRGL